MSAILRFALPSMPSGKGRKPALAASALAIILLAGTIVPSSPTPLPGPGVVSVPCGWGPDGASNPLQAYMVVGRFYRMVCKDMTIEVANLTVDLTEELVFDNVTLLVDAAPTDPQGFAPTAIRVRGLLGTVADGGSLVIKDSLVRALDPQREYDLVAEDGTTLRIEGSTIEDTRGIFAFASEVREFSMRGSRILHTRLGIHTGITASSAGSGPAGPSNVWIQDNLIYDAETSAIDIIGKPDSIQGNTISRCGWSGNGGDGHGQAINFDWQGSVPSRFTDNTITNCQVGVERSSHACESALVLRSNDIFANWWMDAGGQRPMCGDLDNNWWGMDRSDGGPLPAYRIDGDPSLKLSQWAKAPFHPERLPQVHVGAAPVSAALGTPIRFDASASLPSPRFGFPLASFRWTFGDCSPVMPGPVVSHTFTVPGYHVAQVTVSDDHGLSRTWQQVVAVRADSGGVPGLPPTRTFNEPPGVTGQLQRLESQAGGGLLFDPWAFATWDLDGDDVAATWQWFRNGVHQSDLDDQGHVGEHRLRAGDVWMVRAEACDGRDRASMPGLTYVRETPDPIVGKDSLETAPVAIATDGPANFAPVIDSIAIQSQASEAGQSLKAAVQAHDPPSDGPWEPGDHIWFDYAWSLNGRPVPDLAGDTVPGGRLHAGDVWALAVTARDWQDSTTASAQIRIA